MDKLEEKLLSGLSVEKAYKHMEFLVNDVGERLAGTEKIEKAANYIKNEMEKYGLEARIDSFPMYHSYPKGAALRVLSPETKVITAKPTCHIASTLPEGIEGDLVYANVGGYEDYEGLDVAGKVVLTGMTWAPPRPEKARIAYEKGAKALVIMNWGPEDNPVIQMGGTKSQWGNPTPETFKTIPQIPVISITRAAGEYLRRLCEKGEVRVWLQAEATREWVWANQPTGAIKVDGDSDEFILVGSHLEAWGKTAICNSSGEALTLELARVLAQHRDALKRNVVFAFWDGHEVAEAAGSSWFVDKYWDNLTRNCVAYVNIDNPGIKETTIPSINSVTELKAFLLNLIQEQWGRKGDWHDAYKGGDASFFGIGVPYISFSTRYTPEKLKEYNYASLSPWLHSDADTIDKIDRGLFEKHLHFFGSLVLKLCNLHTVPYDFVSVAEGMKADLDALRDLGAKERELNLDQLEEKIDQFKEITSDLDERIQSTKEYNPVLNRTLIKISRELSHILRSESGRYGHDPYGYSLVGKPIPRLYVPIAKIAELDEESDEFKLWETQLMREKNRVSDAIDNSIDYTSLALELFDEKY